MLTPRYEKMTRHRMLPFEWRLYFSEEKVFLSGCSPRASCFSERRAGGSFGVQFRLTSFGLIGGLKRLFSYFALGREAQACFQPFCFLFRVLAFSYPHRRAQACFQLFCSRPGSSGMFSAILLFFSGKQLVGSHDKTCCG